MFTESIILNMSSRKCFLLGKYLVENVVDFHNFCGKNRIFITDILSKKSNISGLIII